MANFLDPYGEYAHMRPVSIDEASRLYSRAMMALCAERASAAKQSRIGINPNPTLVAQAEEAVESAEYLLKISALEHCQVVHDILEEVKDPTGYGPMTDVVTGEVSHEEADYLNSKKG